MTAEIDAVGLHSRDSAGGVDGGISLDENHAGHVTSHELSIVGARRCSSALRCDEAVALQLIRELLQHSRLEAGENQRRFYGFKRGTRRQSGSRGGLAGEAELQPGGLCRGNL